MAKKMSMMIVPYDPYAEIREEINEYDGKLRDFGLWAADKDCKAITPHGDEVTCEFPGDDEHGDDRDEESLAMPKRY